MYYSIEKLKECNWCLSKYMKEVAIRSYGLCISLRDDTTHYSEDDLRKFFKERDILHQEEIKRRQELPIEPTDEELRNEYNASLESAAKNIARYSSQLCDIRQAIVDVETVLEQVEKRRDVENSAINGKEIVLSALKTLGNNLHDEAASLDDIIGALKNSLNRTFDEYKEKELKTYEKKLDLAIERGNEKDDWVSLSDTYDEYVNIVNSFNL